MTREDVISKVRKLLELSKSSNENEAALAAAKAREMLSRYNLTLADLPAGEMRGALDVVECSADQGKTIRHWVKGLFIHVAAGFECEPLIRRRNGDNPLLTFIGTAADANVAKFVFQFLYCELNRLVDEALPQLKKENRGWSAASLRYAYLDGAVLRIGQRYREETQTIRRNEQQTCTDLMVVKQDMIRDYMAGAFPHLRREYSRRRLVSARAFERGYQDAGDIDIRRTPHAEGREQFLESA